MDSQKLENSRVQFRYCDFRWTPIECEIIKRKNGYTENELKKVLRYEGWGAFYKTGIGAVVAIYLGGKLAAGAAAMTAAAGYSSFFYFVGLGTGVSLPFCFKKINPWHQVKQALVLTHDEIVFLDHDENHIKFVDRVVEPDDDEGYDIHNLLLEILPD